MYGISSSFFNFFFQVGKTARKYYHPTFPVAAVSIASRYLSSDKMLVEKLSV